MLTFIKNKLASLLGLERKCESQDPQEVLQIETLSTPLKPPRKRVSRPKVVAKKTVKKTIKK
jgi:hypothetical protein